MTPGTAWRTGAGSKNFSGDLGANFLAGTLDVAYFVVNGTSAGSALWTSGTTGASLTNVGYNSTTAISTAASNNLAHGDLGTGNAIGSNAWVLQSNTYSYYKQLDKNGTGIGTFDQFYGSNVGEIALVQGSSVQQDLFDWVTPNVESTIFGSYTLTTSLSSAGVITTTETPIGGSPTPIPPSVLLLGSGLLGLVGIRRRNLFNL